jgi:hypothetical protein
MSTTVNPTLELGEGLFKDLVWDAEIEVALTALFSYAPYLGWPPLRQIISAIIKFAANRFWKQVKLAVDIGAVTILDAQRKAAFDKASVVLKIIAIDKGIDSPEFKKAKDEAKIALSKFAHFNG